MLANVPLSTEEEVQAIFNYCPAPQREVEKAFLKRFTKSALYHAALHLATSSSGEYDAALADGRAERILARLSAGISSRPYRQTAYTSRSWPLVGDWGRLPELWPAPP